MCIRFKETDVRCMGRTAMGVIGMNLDDGDEIVGMQIDTQGSHLLIASEMGMGKRTLVSEFGIQKRGGKGVKCYKITEKTGNVVGVKAVNEDNEVMMITTEGVIIQIAVGGISVYGRNTSGVKLINLDDGVTVAKIAKVREKIVDSPAEGEDVEELDVSDETESEIEADADGDEDLE
jgi:DNA gyrase subunit A